MKENSLCSAFTAISIGASFSIARFQAVRARANALHSKLCRREPRAPRLFLSVAEAVPPGFALADGETAEELLAQLGVALPSPARPTAPPSAARSFFEELEYTLGGAERVVLDDWLTVKLLVSDVQRLDPSQMLNDAIANFALETMRTSVYIAASSRVFANTLSPKTFFLFNTYFCSLIAAFERGDDERTAQAFVAGKAAWLVRRKRFDLASFEVLLIPYHRGMHWNLYAVSDFKSFYRQIVVGAPAPRLHCVALDSLYAARAAHQRNFEVIGKALSSIAVAMARADRGAAPRALTALSSAHSFVCSVAAVPTQSNALDCGPAMLENVELIINGLIRLRFGVGECAAAAALAEIDMQSGRLACRRGVAGECYDLTALALAKRRAVARLIIGLEASPQRFPRLCAEYIDERQKVLRSFLSDKSTFA